MRIYFGHHKCASRYIRKIITLSAKILGQSFYEQEARVASPSQKVGVGEPPIPLTDSLSILVEQNPSFLMLYNSCPQYLIRLSNRISFKGFHLIRDPRDILVSAYFSHRFTHRIDRGFEWTKEVRKNLEEFATVEKGLLYEMEVLESQFIDMGHWNYQHQNILELRFEELIANPTRIFKDIFKFFDIEVTSSFRPETLIGLANFLRCRYYGKYFCQIDKYPNVLLLATLRRFSFPLLSGGRLPGEENQMHHFRKGISGDWINYFTPLVKERFKERYGDLLIKLDYERNFDW